ncbi:biotin--[acetyl-CoA-carboxylase] ligase [Pseudochryseolinea flava]|uniref:biotin--[acetyl-CoA-carboxylase] ligase n=1 Tax=Pseudochryseolinea flava TaxID=2059302 RepID=UPI001403F3B2|nr:biotin--[acetyl-CoA-carboxylase] ligase [Pseudochryseolinea flava]
MPECRSTNDLALQLCQQSSVTEGTLVITTNQTKGRGQRGNSWLSSPGLNLTFSLIFKPTFLSVANQFYLNIFTALAVHDYLKARITNTVAVKWPNDILVDDQKICGILVENQIQGSHFQAIIAGIGVNINEHNFSAPVKATSLSLKTQQTHDLQEELELLLHKIEIRYLQLKEGKLAQLKEDYIRALFWRNEQHTFAAFDKQFQGSIIDIDDTGRLLVDVDGNVRAFDLKEIAYIR